MKAISVKIKNLSNEVTHAGFFDTIEEANAWIAKQEAMERPWGFPKAGEYLELPARTQEYTEEDRVEEVSPGVFETVHYYVLPDQITIEGPTDNSAAIEEEKERQRLISLGENDEKCCIEVLRYIGGANRDRTLTAEQISEMQTLFSTIEAYLRASRPDSAKALIVGLVPDEVLVTTVIKRDILAIFTKYGI